MKATTSTSSSATAVAKSPTKFESELPMGETEHFGADESTADIKVEQTKNRTPQEVREAAAKTVVEDLELWEGKFTKAAEEGATEIEERVTEIASRMIQRQAEGMGKALLKQLEESATAELEGLKKSIVSIIKEYGDDPTKRDEELATAIRAAGLVIRDKAHDIRTWRQTYEQEAEIAVTKAAQEHYTILQKTRDLALQKIGMKWAWMDGVTYNDWKKYHELKARFDEWTVEFKQLITTHPGLLEAQKIGAEIEDEGMSIAQAAAEELGRLKQVATWKAIAGDSSESFDTEMTELAAINVARKAQSEAQSSASMTSTVPREAESSLGSADEGVSEPVLSTDSETVTVSLSLASAESNPVDNANDYTSETTNLANSDETLQSSDLIDGPEQVQETIIEEPSDPTIPVEGIPTTTVKSALFGAAAQSVPSRQPILDEDIVSSASSAASVVQSDVPASITSAAQSAYTAALAGAADHYSRAMSIVSAQIHGEPKPIHEEMLSSVSNAYFGAVATANSRLNAAMTAASEGIYGTPTAKWVPGVPTVPSLDWERVQSIAQRNLDDSLEWASQHYESAKVAIGASEPTPSSYLEGVEKSAEKVLDQAKHNYYAGVGIAHARYSEFLSAASTAVSSLTAAPTPTNVQESASSVASVAGESVASAASVASEGAESIAGSVGDLASHASEYIGENWDALLSRVSSQVYSAPTPTPWYENIYTAATDYAASATDAAGSQVSSATALAGDYAGAANDAAASQFSIVSSLVSELVAGKEPPFTESVYSRLVGAYSTGLSSASSFASAASATAVSAAGEAGNTASSVVDAATEKAKHLKDEL